MTLSNLAANRSPSSHRRLRSSACRTKAGGQSGNRACRISINSHLWDHSLGPTAESNASTRDTGAAILQPRPVNGLAGTETAGAEVVRETIIVPARASDLSGLPAPPSSDECPDEPPAGATSSGPIGTPERTTPDVSSDSPDGGNSFVRLPWKNSAPSSPHHWGTTRPSPSGVRGNEDSTSVAIGVAREGTVYLSSSFCLSAAAMRRRRRASAKARNIGVRRRNAAAVATATISIEVMAGGFDSQRSIRRRKPISDKHASGPPAPEPVPQRRNGTTCSS